MSTVPVTAVTPASRQSEIGGRFSPMDPSQHANTRYHIESLVEAAEAERLAAHGRRLHADEHLAHPTFDHPHVPNGVRGALGHALIGLGAAIAGRPAEPEARRAA